MSKNNIDKKVAVVTGGSSGIGKFTAKKLLDKGCVVYELSRRNNSAEGIIHIETDVTNEANVKNSIERIMAEQGQIDILVCCAGYGISGAAEFTEAGDAHSQLEVNLFGVDNCVRAVIPKMRSRKKGRIVCISSIAGIVSIPYQTWYSVSKAAINAYVMGIQNEIKQFGISICSIMPGDINTGFTSARKKIETGDDIYNNRISK